MEVHLENVRTNEGTNKKFGKIRFTITLNELIHLAEIKREVFLAHNKDKKEFGRGKRGGNNKLTLQR